MKQIVTYFVILLISGCSSLAHYFDNVPLQSPETKPTPTETKPTPSTHAQQALLTDVTHLASVIPAKAGIHKTHIVNSRFRFAGMTRPPK